MHIRFATPLDVPIITQLVHELAHYERSADKVVATADDIALALFGERPHVYCHVAELEGEVVGFAVWFLNFSTWLGTSGIYLEDLYVREHVRARGVGTALMKELARLCVERGYSRFQWWVLDWNQPSIEFYQSLGAVAMDEWTVFRLSDDALHKFATTRQ
ncbi:MAG: GNAT family N-acetyltransferase [Acidobacteria bacterium]|nr:GNAT family N-acetyltransferase [Acidobacteriota bacterium]